MRTALAVVAASATLSHAQLIVGNDQSGSATIYNVDVGTGVAAAIYTSTTAEAKPWGMAYDPATDTLYWNNGGTMYKSPMGPTLVPQNLGPLSWNGSAINFVALAFRDGRLLGTRNITTEAVYEIDPATLAVNQLYIYPSTFDFGGLDTDTSTNTLYALSDTPSTARGLYKIDLAAPSEALIAPYPPGETDIDGLAVHNGVAYFVTDGPQGTQPNFYLVDVATGQQTGTLPSPFTGSGTFCAATYAAPGAPPCYPDCNGDGALNLSDFGCFTTKFALGDPYADCNGDSVLNLSDFGCFTTKFALGCP
ncbi:MAG: EF-hand domain-containing protein [Phycisphaerales bacterium]|nr:EF-hand domain-containing protein [Phycisphaerales bacterium]